MRVALILMLTALLSACSTVNVGNLTPDDVQNEKGWRYFEAADLTGRAVENLCLSEQAGLPLIAWRSSALEEAGVRTELHIVRAQTADLRNWGTEQLAWANAAGEAYASELTLEVVAGHPALAFYGTSATGGDNSLCYLRAGDSAGTQWGTPQAVAPAGRAQFGCSMLVVDGQPALQYINSTGSGPNAAHTIRFVRASDMSGEFWPQPVDVYDEAWSAQWRPSLALVTGNPAICFAGRHTFSQDGTIISAPNLSYARALDRVGSQWGTASILDLSPGAGEFAQLAQIGDHPAVYYRVASPVNAPFAPPEMRYLAALDATGFTWGTARFLGIGNGWQIVDLGGRAFASNAVDPAQSQLGGTPYLAGRLDLDGSGANWSSELFVDYTSSVTLQDLAVVAGHPALAYVSSGKLVFASYHL